MKDSISKPNNTVLRAARVIGAALFWLAVWLLAYHGVGRDIVVPSPFAVMGELARLVQTAEFWRVIGFSVVRVALGIVFALVFGTLLGVLSAVNPLFRRLSGPMLAVIQATPVVSFIIVALIWFHSDHVAVFIAFLMCLPVIWNNVSTGIGAVDPALLEMAQVFRIPRIERVRRIYAPSLRPFFAAAMTTVFGLAWKVSVAAEVLSHPRYGIGTHLHSAKVYLDTPSLFAWTAVVVLLSIAFDKLFARIFRPRAARSPVPGPESGGMEIDSPGTEESERGAAHGGLCAAPSGSSPGRGTPRIDAVQADALSFSYGSLCVLDGFSARLEGGQIHCLFGPSGCGKTTLLRLIAGLLRPDAGRVDTGAGECAAGYVFQEDRLLPWASVRGNLEFVLRGRYPQDEASGRIDRMMRAVRLDRFADYLPAQLSGGMRQRVNVARALIIGPDLLLMDEPFKGLDAELKSELMNYVRAYRLESAATVLFTTHDRQEADCLADHVHHLSGPPLRNREIDLEKKYI